MTMSRFYKNIFWLFFNMSLHKWHSPILQEAHLQSVASLCIYYSNSFPQCKSLSLTLSAYYVFLSFSLLRFEFYHVLYKCHFIMNDSQLYIFMNKPQSITLFSLIFLAIVQLLHSSMIYVMHEPHYVCITMIKLLKFFFIFFIYYFIVSNHII